MDMIELEIKSGIGQQLLKNFNDNIKKMESILYMAPEFIAMIKTSVPETTLRAVLTSGQKEQLAKGALKIMTKKDGTLLACLINPKTQKVFQQIPLESVTTIPDFTSILNDVSMQLQMAQMMEVVTETNELVDEVRRGQENDRIAGAYSCEENLILTLACKNKKERERQLYQIANDAECCRQKLILSQKESICFVTKQPETFWGKFFKGTRTEKIENRLEEMRRNFNAINLVSIIQAICYKELNENEQLKISIATHQEYIKSTFLGEDSLIQRLDLISSSVEPFWNNNVDTVLKRIEKINYISSKNLIEGVA